MDSREPSDVHQEAIVPDEETVSRKENAPKKANQAEVAGSQSRGDPFASRNGRLYMCPECSYLTQHSRKLTVHLKTHTDEPFFPCPECHYRFDTQGRLHRHIVHGHCRGKATAGLRKSSRRRKRPSVPVHKCDRCVYFTTHPYNLKVHMRTHTGVRPYACDPCGSRFRTQSHLYRHMLSKRHQAAST
ncbi:transcription factor HIVEP3-like isoform X2 [Osmerus eperlanus]